MKNTNCQKCIFSGSVDSPNSCEFDMINLLSDKKDITIENNYYYIRDYMCRYAYSKNSEYSPEQKQDIIDYILANNFTLPYYLVIYSKDTVLTSDIINTINSNNLCPGFVSFIFDHPNLGLDSIKELDNFPDKKFKYKVHNLLQSDLKFETILSNVIETNLGSSNQKYIYFKHIKDIKFLSSDILSIQKIIHIDQPSCDIITSNRYNISELFDIFLPINYYLYIKDFFKKNFRESLLSIPDPQIAYYA
jgi:hypothetical protein